MVSMRVNIWLIVIYTAYTTVVSSTRTNITIVGLVYQKTTDEHGYWRALELAKQLMENSTDFKELTDNYEVQLQVFNVPNNPTSAVLQASGLLRQSPPPLVILGPDLPQLTEHTSDAFSQHNTLMVPFLPLKNLGKSPKHVISSCPSVGAVINAELAFMTHFTWARVGVVYDFRSANGVYTLITDELINSLRNHSVEITGYAGIDPSSNDVISASKVISEELSSLKASDTKIFVAEMDARGAVTVFCEAYKLALFGPDIVWLLSPIVETLDTWASLWNTSLDRATTVGCTREQIQIAADRAFVFQRLAIRKDNNHTASGLTSSKYRDKLVQMAAAGQETSPDKLMASSYGFDAFWSVGSALNNLVKQNISIDTNAANMSVLSDAIVTELEKVSFDGMTGDFSFANHERNGVISIKQFRDNATRLVDIGMYITRLKRLDISSDASSLWTNNQVPPDQTPKPAKTPLVIAALFHSNTLKDNFGSIRSVQLAKEMISNRSEFRTLTNNYDIQITSGYGVRKATSSIFYSSQLVRLETKPLLFLYSGSSRFIEPTELSLDAYKTLLVPTTSDDSSKSTVMSVSPQLNAFIDAKVALMNKFKWTRTAILYNFRPRDGDTDFASFVDKLTEKLKDSHISITGTFGIDPTTTSLIEESTLYIREKLEALQKADTKIFNAEVGMYGALSLFCEIYKLKLYGPDVVWLLNQMVREMDKWWQFNSTASGRIFDCTKEQIKEAATGAFTFERIQVREDNNKTTSGLTVNEYMQKIVDMAVPGQETDPTKIKLMGGYSFDAFWAISVALNNSATILHQQNRTFLPQKSSTRNLLKEQLAKVKFEGVTGPFQFCNNKRQGIIIVRQFQADGSLKTIGQYFRPLKDNGHAADCTRISDVLKLYNESSLWPNGVPLDRSTTLRVTLTIKQPVMIAIATATAVGILLGVLFLTFNLVYRKYKFIKLSAPLFNNIIALGCILCLCSVYLFGVHDASGETFAVICKARAWTLSLGFSCAFGAMFIKTWRIYKICTNKKLKVKLGPLSNWYLLALVGAIIAVDLVLLITWEIVDPLKHSVYEFPKEKHETKPYTYVLNVLNTCSASDMILWLTLFYVYKGILLLYGLFLAYETRNVIYAHLNDSRVIGICVYNVVVLSIVGAFLSLLLKEDNYEVMYVVLSVCIIFPATATICLLLFPKVSYRCKTNNLDDADATMTANGTQRSITMDITSTYHAEPPPAPREKSPSTPNVPTVVLPYQNGRPVRSASAVPPSTNEDSKSDDRNSKESLDKDSKRDQNQNGNHLTVDVDRKS